MTDPGLNTRLRQRSRRAGIMIGISMALTIAVCVAGFSVIYAALDGFTGDFVSRDAPTAVPTNARQTTEVAQVAGGAQGQPSAQPTADTAAAAPTTVPTEAPVATASPSAFAPNYQITSTSTVNLRSGPGVKGNATITALSPQTPLQFLNDRQKTTDPDGDGFSGDWLKFRTESGDDGWVREIDVGTYVP